MPAVRAISRGSGQCAFRRRVEARSALQAGAPGEERFEAHLVRHGSTYSAEVMRFGETNAPSWQALSSVASAACASALAQNARLV
jgi:hypothetical protein